MNRRRYLAALAGLTGLAGCASNGSQPTPTETPTPTDTATPTFTTSPTPTDSPTPTPKPVVEPVVSFLDCYTVRVEGPSYAQVSFILSNSTIRDFPGGYEGANEFTERGETPIEEVVVFYADNSTNVPNPELESCADPPTPTPEPGNPHLDAAYSKLIESYEAYLAAGEGGFHDIDETDSMTEPEIREPLYAAREDLREAERDNLDSEESSRLSDLQSVYWFFWWLPDIHIPLNKAYRSAETGWGFAADGSFDRAISQLEEAESHAVDVGPELEKLKNDSRGGAMDSFEPLSPDDYHRKVGAIETAVNQIEQIRPLVNDLKEISTRVGYGVSDYTDEDYGRANDDFATAADLLNDFSSKVDGLAWRSSFSMIEDDLSCLIDPLQEGTDLMIEASAAGADGNENTRKLRKDEACTAYGECDLVTSVVPSIENLC